MKSPNSFSNLWIISVCLSAFKWNHHIFTISFPRFCNCTQNNNTLYTDSIIHAQTLVPCVIQTRTVCRPRLVSLSRSLFLLPHSEQLANGSALLLSSVLQKNDCVYERAQHMDWDLTHGSHTDIVQLCWLAAY